MSIKIAKELLRVAKNLIATEKALIDPKNGKITFSIEDDGSALFNPEKELLKTIKSVRLTGFKVNSPKKVKVKGKDHIVVEAVGKSFDADELVSKLVGKFTITM